MATFTANQRIGTQLILPVTGDDSASIAPDLSHPDQKFYIYPGGNVDVIFRGHDFEYSNDLPIGGFVNSIEIGHNPDASTYVVDYKLQNLNVDMIGGSLSPEVIFAGRDTINGSRFGDRINGFDGSDKLTGGAGSDTFYFTTSPDATNVDRITDFTHGRDKIALDRDIFHGLTPANLGAAFHDTTTSAEQHDDRILYNHQNGWLSYDADGKGGHAPVHFATLDHHPVVTSADFLLV